MAACWHIAKKQITQRVTAAAAYVSRSQRAASSAK